LCLWFETSSIRPLIWGSRLVRPPWAAWRARDSTRERRSIRAPASVAVRSLARSHALPGCMWKPAVLAQVERSRVGPNADHPIWMWAAISGADRIAASPAETACDLAICARGRSGARVDQRRA
jgi:hypothetical protein